MMADPGQLTAQGCQALTGVSTLVNRDNGTAALAQAESSQMSEDSRQALRTVLAEELTACGQQVISTAACQSSPATADRLRRHPEF